MSTLKVNNLQVGQDGTAANNYTLYQPASPDGTVRLGYGVAGSVTDILTLKNSRLGIGTDNPEEDLHIASNSPYILLDDIDNSQKWKLKGTAWFAIEDTTSGVDRLRIGSAGQIGLGGANYGSSGQVLTSGGPGSAVTWSTIASDKITEGNTEAEVVDTGSDGHFKVTTEGNERLRITSDGLVRVPDEGKLTFGASDDLKIYHSATQGHSFIQDEGTGNLYIDANQLYLRNSDTDSVLLQTTSAGAVQIKHNGTKKFETTTTGATITSDLILNHASGDKAIRWATGGTNKWSIYHNNGAGALIAYDNANNAERLRITSDGKVGIGTDNPDYGLHVYGDGDILIEDSSNGSAHLRLRSSNGGTDVSNWKMKTSSNNFLYIENDTVGGTSQFTIDNSGKIGVNDNTPSVSLDLASNTDAVSLPTGTTAQRPSGTDAYIRKNSTNNALEFYNGTNWVEIITDYFPTGSTTLG